MTGIRYGIGNLDTWEQFGISIGFATGAKTILCCNGCHEQWMAEPGNRVAAGLVLMEVLVHVAHCPPRQKVPPGDGPVAMEILDRGLYKLFTAAEVNNDNEDDAA